MLSSTIDAKFLIFSLCFLSKITANKVFSLATAAKDDDMTLNNLISCKLSMAKTVEMTRSDCRKKFAPSFKYHVILYWPQVQKR